MSASYFGRVDLVPDVQVDTFRIPDEGVRLLDLPDDEYRQGLIAGLARCPLLLDLEQVYLRPPQWHLRIDAETGEEWSEPMTLFGRKVDVEADEVETPKTRTQAICDQFTRYGSVDDADLLDALRALTDVNDDLQNCGAGEVVSAAVDRAIAHLEGLKRKQVTA